MSKRCSAFCRNNTGKPRLMMSQNTFNPKNTSKYTCLRLSRVLFLFFWDTSLHYVPGCWHCAWTLWQLLHCEKRADTLRRYQEIYIHDWRHFILSRMWVQLWVVVKSLASMCVMCHMNHLLETSAQSFIRWNFLILLHGTPPNFTLTQVEGGWVWRLYLVGGSHAWKLR